ncbi:LacI family DNA-binding transcriptional regulator, partial [Microbacterium sp. CCH5-D1]
MSPRRPRDDRAPSQVDVAQLAGVSTQTVSRVMSGQDNVRPDTARRVLAAVEELGYRVHAAAASLASGRTRVLGVIVVSTDRYSS